MSLTEKMDALDNDKVKKAFKELVEAYIAPAYGSMSKRDFDILLFMKLQDLGIIDRNPEIYDIVSTLKVTRTKARNLLYESKMRSTSPAALDDELKNLLLKPMFLKDNDKIAFEIANPLLSDHMRAKLKRLGHITDGSFSPELIRLTDKAYIALFEEMIPEEASDTVRDALIACGAREDTSLKGVLLSMLNKLSKKVVGRVGEDLMDEASEYLLPIIKGNIDEIKNICGRLFSES
ncbi:hypothetical protein [Bacteroides heparinolyticus]|uniref:hypothetical protein n=1 Tax=Prevotella heparinolytica TaxID=28113 RepID=UPI0035A0635A